jgi:hypothetical protein
MQKVAYEVALEGAGQAIGHFAELIAIEEASGQPDAEAIGRWRAEQAAWARRRRVLTPENSKEVRAIYSEGEVLLAEPEEDAGQPGRPVQHEQVLDEAENERIFQERIVPDELTGTPQERPVVVIVAGQPGDGKAVVSALVTGVLVRHGRAPVVIAADRYQPHWPGSRGPLEEEPAPAEYLGADSLRWMDKALAYARSHRLDVVVESVSVGPGDVERTAREFSSAGYRVEIALLAVPEAASRFGVLDRHLRALEVYGYGRLADPALHDNSCRRVLETAQALDRELFADRVAVLRPDGQVIQGNGRDPQPSSTADAVEQERNRTWTAAESRKFLHAVDEFQRIGRSAPIEWIQREAAEGAKLVTSMARPFLHPDAVTMHIATAGVLPLDV